MRVQGNQIGRQRQVAFDYWLDNTEFDWTLWVDSDIELTKPVLDALWATADPFDKPVVSGVYFISKENEQSKMTPYPAVFNFTDDPNKISYVHPLPKNAIIRVGCAGFGLLLIHRSVGEAMRSHHAPRRVFFNETGEGEQFVSEDINFFRALYETRIPVYAHTGAVVKHMKRFSYDVEYYKLFWNNHESTQG